MANQKKTNGKKAGNGNASKDLKEKIKKDPETDESESSEHEDSEKFEGGDPLIGSDEHGAGDGDADFHPNAAAGEEVGDLAEVPEEVSFDDLTDDEREMLGLEAKPKTAASDDDSDGSGAGTGMSWEEFGYDEEELQ
jgi:uncharacterized protein YfiM (DUF2279 family)